MLLNVIEILAVLFSLSFLFLLIKENKWCWPFGIISSALSVYYFYEINLYAESILYIFYIFIGFYGWWVWEKSSRETFNIVQWKITKHIPLILGGGILAYAIFYVFKNFTNAARPMVDSFTTSFGFIASFLELYKIFGTWIYWIILNATSIWLYYDRGANFYAGLMLIYLGFSFYGYYNWRRKLGLM